MWLWINNCHNCHNFLAAGLAVWKILRNFAAVLKITTLMNSNELTPARMHDLLKRNVFSDIDLERVASMDADQRR